MAARELAGGQGSLTERITFVRKLNGDLLEVKSKIPFATQRAFTTRILKGDVSRQFGVPPDQQILSIPTRGEPLEDHEVLGHQEIFMTIDITGGAFARKRKHNSSPTKSKSSRIKPTSNTSKFRLKPRFKRRLDPDFVSETSKATAKDDDSDSEVDLMDLLESFQFSEKEEPEEQVEEQVAKKKKRRKK